MSRFRLPALAVCCLLAAGAFAGCRSSAVLGGGAPVPAEDLPERFLVGSLTGPQTAEPVPGEGCRSPMVDPRDATRLVLVRSSAGRGDYAVPDGRYGLREGHLLQLDCATGRVLGAVPR